MRMMNVGNDLPARRESEVTAQDHPRFFHRCMGSSQHLWLFLEVRFVI